MDARKTYPYSASGKLFFKNSAGSQFICSASVIKPRIVVTAGHCVHSGKNGSDGFYQDIIYIPAWHEGEAPFGVWPATWVTTSQSWATSNGAVPNDGDFAVFEVADQEIGGQIARLGDVTGTYGYRTNGLLKNHLKIIGYPGSFDNGNIMHQVDTGSPEPAEENTVLYGSDMTGGSSGGPWIQNFGVKSVGQLSAFNDTPNTIVGVTSYGFIASEPKVQGSSTLNDVFEALLKLACDRNIKNC